MSTFFITYNLLNRTCFTAQRFGGAEEWKKVHMLINPVYHKLLWFSIRHNRGNSLVGTFSATRSLLTSRNVSILDQTLIKTKLKCQKFNIEVFVFLLRLISESRCHVSILEQKSFSIKTVQWHRYNIIVPWLDTK